MFHIARQRNDGLRMHGRRMFDVVFGVLALVAASPVILAAAMAIKLDDRRPVIFRQVRVSRGGQLFRILKFRTGRTITALVGGPEQDGGRDPR